MTRRRVIPTLLTLAILAIAAPCVHAQRTLDKEEIRQLNGVELEEHAGATLPLDAPLTTADGDEVVLGDYFTDDRPAIFVFVYYECPIVCPTVLRSLAQTMNELDYDTGDDYRVLAVSFDHTEKVTQALGKRGDFYRMYERAENDAEIRSGIEFFTAPETSVERIATAAGFEFNPIQGGEFAHPVSLMAVSPEGKLTRYIYGYNYPARELKLTLLDASEGKIAESIGDSLMHFCYRYDPTTGSYSMVAFRVMQIGAGVSVVVLAGFLGLLFMGDRVRRKRHLAGHASGETASRDQFHQTGAAQGAVTGRMS